MVQVTTKKNGKSCGINVLEMVTYKVKIIIAII